MFWKKKKSVCENYSALNSATCQFWAVFQGLYTCYKGKTQQEIANALMSSLGCCHLCWHEAHVLVSRVTGMLRLCQGQTLKDGIVTILLSLSLHLQVCPCMAATSFFSLSLFLLCFAEVTVRIHRIFLYRAFVQKILYLVKLCLRLCVCTRVMKWLHASVKWQNLSHN